MALNRVTITGTFDDGSGTPLSGSAQFTPSQAVYASGVQVLQPDTPVTAQISGGQLEAVELVATDNSGLSVLGQTGFWFWVVSVTIGGQVQPSWSFFLPSSPSSVALYSLANTPASGVAGAIVPAVVALSQSAGSVAVNAALGNVFTLTLTASGWTISNPSSPADGQVIRIRLTQDGTGSRTVTWGSAYDWGTGNSAPALSSAASAVDVLAFEYDAVLSKWMYLGASFPQGF